jgi:hypothetical protein
MFDFPELSVGMTTEGIDVRSVGNTLTLHETALVEAFNLKAAIEYQLKNCKLHYIIRWIKSSCIFFIMNLLQKRKDGNKSPNSCKTYSFREFENTYFWIY